jgi:hypothetical protein
MKKFIALLISASVIAAPVAFAFAADEQAGNPDTAMQQMTSNDQTANDSAPAAKPAKKGHRPCHCKNCAHKHHHKSQAKQPASAAQ